MGELAIKLGTDGVFHGGREVPIMSLWIEAGTSPEEEERQINKAHALINAVGDLYIACEEMVNLQKGSDGMPPVASTNEIVKAMELAILKAKGE
jgi:hypothetical protein